MFSRKELRMRFVLTESLSARLFKGLDDPATLKGITKCDRIKCRWNMETPFLRYGITVRGHTPRGTERWPVFQGLSLRNFDQSEAALLMSASALAPFAGHPPIEFKYFRIAIRIRSAVLGTVYLLQNKRPASDHPNLAYVALKDGVAREICHLDYYGSWYATEPVSVCQPRFLRYELWTDPDFGSTTAVIGVKSLLNELMEKRVMFGPFCPPDPWELVRHGQSSNTGTLLRQSVNIFRQS